MVGITAWQQQIPIPQNYSGSNAWRIPLKPVPAEKPMSAKTGFFRGAIALAVNGVPIFNPIKNDGRTDTNLAGELDEFGGHCGRADDYHYHLPPVHLEKIVGAGKPIAYALDGYPILGFQSKDEARISKLDNLNGHKDDKGNYHYHSTKAYPYLNGGFYGRVSERGGQVDPQPRAQGIRPALRGLRGATITGFERSKDGKKVSVQYELRGEKRSVSYTTVDFKKYTFTFDNGSRGKSTESYTQRSGGSNGRGNRDQPRGRRAGGDQNSGTPDASPNKRRQPGNQGPPTQSQEDGPRQPWIVVHADEIDLNKDKIISHDELVGESEKAFDGYDKNSDQKLSQEELNAREGSRSAMGGFLRGHAKEIDRDGDGILTRDEAVNNARRMFGKMDRNRDGNIDESELKAATRTGDSGSFQRNNEDRPGNQRMRGKIKPDVQQDDRTRYGVEKQDRRRGGGNRSKRQGGGGSRLGGYETPPPANKVPEHDFDILLGRPTDKSVTASILLYRDAEAVVHYGTNPNDLTEKTEAFKAVAGEPVELEIENLEPNTSYSYQLKYRIGGESQTNTSDVHSFQTQRTPTSSFRFTVQADSHLDENTSGDVYLRTLRNALIDGPDFHVALGDTFMTGKYVRPELAEPQYLAQRYYLGSLCHSTPLFFCLGNHDGESAKGRQRKNSRGRQGQKSNSNPTRTWSVNTRKKYFPNPYPDLKNRNSFYSGNRDRIESVGQIEDYYAWHWGNSLFVVLDPFWYSQSKPKTEGVHWHQTLGDEQYRWLAKTLAESNAKFKFVFIHHLIGGADKNNRGGVASAPYFEWGGKELDGTSTFAKNRPNWELPIHELLVKNDVDIVFHGHDHLYAKEELDGIIYQAVPQPGHPRFGNVRSAEDYGYAGEVISSSGHLRISVSSDSARVDYVRAYLPKDETSRRKNGEISTSYLLK
jgi:predicted phosphodiesterase